MLTSAYTSVRTISHARGQLARWPARVPSPEYNYIAFDRSHIMLPPLLMGILAVLAIVLIIVIIIKIIKIIIMIAILIAIVYAAYVMGLLPI
jgi:hypothetical protein